MLTIAAASLEYVRVPVTATAAGLPVDPTSDSVAMAFMPNPTTQPGSGDWHTASWDTGTFGGRYIAQCLIGPGGGVQLNPATWWVWVKIVDSPEVPVRAAGTLQII